MGAINPNKTGLLFAVLLGGWHLAWTLVPIQGSISFRRSPMASPCGSEL